MRQLAKHSFVAGVLLAVLIAPQTARATHDTINTGALLFTSPTSGTVTVGDTFDVSIFIDTSDHVINTIDLRLKFPSDKLQVVSPSVGKSIIGIWTAPPSFNNTTGELHFQGGIPSPGINTSRGLISTVTFRAKSVGTASISFAGDSKALLNDGFGTNILTDTRGASLRVGLPLPAGPIVTSPTHPDQGEWYRIKTAILEWVTEYESVGGFSYVLNNTPIDEPDDISEGTEREISYKNLSDGFHYFHIQAFRNDRWGGTTHFAIKIDGTAPAEFDINVLPRARTTSQLPIFDFNTTDAQSGISHYELRLVSLDVQRAQDIEERAGENFFIEVPTRYIPDVALDLGQYDVIVRAYDNAGNFRESVKRISVVNPVFTYSEEGVIVANKVSVPWLLIILGGLLIIALLIYLAVVTTRRHHHATLRRVEGALEDPVIKRRLEELQKQRQKRQEMHHRMAVFLLIISVGLTGLPAMQQANAQEIASLPPPITTTISDNISNDQLFYVGGQTDIADSEVIIFLQNLQDGQVTSNIVKTDAKGDWFYTNPEPLLKGTYLLWTQSKVGNELSPPSPQRRVNVSQTAFELGSSRLSFETLYFLLAVILFIAIVLLGGFVAYHSYHERRKRADLRREIQEADDVIREGFATLHEDINAELEVIRKAKLDKVLSVQHEEREKRLIKDLEEIESFIKKEFKDVRLKGRAM